jgi:hypothetical protein
LEVEAQPKKKDSMPKEDLQSVQLPPQQVTNNFMNNNWVAKTDFKGLKNIKGIEEDLIKKDPKPVIIVKPNNTTIVNNQQY